MDALKVDDFKFYTGLWTYRAKDRSLNLPRGADPLVIVAKDYVVTFRVDGVAHKVTVPMGMMTDLASVPKIFRSIISKVGRYLEAAIVHDYLYGLSGTPFWTRALADAIFLAAMKASNVSRFTRNLIYRVVRLAGGRAYRGTNTIIELPEDYEDQNTYDLGGGGLAGLA